MDLLLLLLGWGLRWKLSLRLAGLTLVGVESVPLTTPLAFGRILHGTLSLNSRWVRGICAKKVVMLCGRHVRGRTSEDGQSAYNTRQVAIVVLKMHAHSEKCASDG